MSTASYDEIPYETKSFPQCHPVKLATMGKLFGMTPTPPDHCHVLELGCADGSNLIPLAQAYPESTFVGVDLASTQIDRGQRIIREVGLTNITLEQKNIVDFTSPGMKFDYIIAHGLYSWVPEEARQSIFALCRDLLTDQGIAYISYNALPGWHMRGMLRDMMRYHADFFDNPKLQYVQARALLAFLAESVPTENNPYGTFLKHELVTMQGREDGYVHHEYLGEDNRAFYFHEFVEDAKKFDLQYLGETELSAMLTGNFPPQVEQALSMVASDVVAMEQYMDFLRNRTFRTTLLARKEVTLVRNVSADVARGLWAASVTTSVNPHVNFIPGHREEFRHVSGRVFSTDSTLVKMILVALQQAWPNQLPFSRLMADIRGHIYGGRSVIHGTEENAREEHLLCEQLVMLYGKGVVELSAFAYPKFESKLAKTLKATPLARYQALNDPNYVTNLRHSSLPLDNLTRQVLALLDGSRDFDQVLEMIQHRARNGEFSIQQHGIPVTDPDAVKAAIAERFAEVLQILVLSGYLQAA